MKGSGKMFRVAVCDDSTEFLGKAASFVERWSEESGVPTDVFPFENGEDLIEKNASTRMDVVFLDIIMPVTGGMDTARELRKNDTALKIVFLTSSPEFALESYDVKASGYLLKPVVYEKIKDILDECCRAYEETSRGIVLKTVFGYRKIFFHDIEYAEAQNKRVNFYLRQNKSVEAIEPFHVYEDKFTEADGFFKCHRSYLVYMPNVDRFSSTEIITRSGRVIPIARGYAKPFKEAYFAMMFGETGGNA